MAKNCTVDVVPVPFTYIPSSIYLHQIVLEMWRICFWRSWHHPFPKSWGSSLIFSFIGIAVWPGRWWIDQSVDQSESRANSSVFPLQKSDMENIILIVFQFGFIKSIHTHSFAPYVSNDWGSFKEFKLLPPLFYRYALMNVHYFILKCKDMCMLKQQVALWRITYIWYDIQTQ